MNCPKCKADLKEQISIKSFLFCNKKEVVVYCPLCDFEKKHIFNLSIADLKQEEKERNSKIIIEQIKAENTKEYNDKRRSEKINGEVKQ